MLVRAARDGATHTVSELAILSDVGGGWTNEDAYGQWTADSGDVVFVVADGVGGREGGEVASRLAVATTLQAYRESPAAWAAAKRLHHAVQQANVVIHNRALAVPELSRMASTLTAVVVSDGTASAVHVGDTRLYLVRGDAVRQLTKDHTVAGERARLRLASGRSALGDPDRSMLTRSLGQDLVAPLDRVSLRLLAGDRLVVCTDGVYTMVHEQELGDYCRDQAAKTACRSLIAAAKRRNATDNLTVAVFASSAGVQTPAPAGWRARLLGLLKRHD